MDTKICTKCGEEKPATTEYFHRCKYSRCGLLTYCKVCRKKQTQKWQKENSEKIRLRQKKWREDNPDYAKKWHKENSEKIHLRQKKYREANREKIRARTKKWCKENPDLRKRWCEANREKIRAHTKKWRKENPDYERSRRRNDPTFRLHRNLRSGLWQSLTGKRTKSHTLEYVGMDKPELWEYLESKFTDGMTRENYGKWHVDHIRPLCSFDFDQFKEGSEEYENMIHEAWRYTNLQPLWAKDNLSKSGKWEGEL